jgi:chaperonin GroES
MALKPLGDRVIVERLEEDVQKTAGGIIIPDTAKEKPQKGKVVAVGDGKRDDDGKRIPLDVKAGDVVFFGKYAGSEFKDGGKEYLVMHESDLIAKDE